MYQALEVQNIDEILPPPPEPQPTDPGIENARALAGQIITVFQEQDHDAHMAVHIQFMKLPIVQASPQAYGMFLSHIQEHIAFKARGIVQQEMQQQMIQVQSLAQVGALTPEQAQMAQIQSSPEGIEARVAQVEAELNAQILQQLMPQGEQQDPLVAIRQQELAIRAADVERRAKLDEAELQLEQQKLMQRAVTDAARIESQEEIAAERADVNRERIEAQQNRG